MNESGVCEPLWQYLFLWLLTTYQGFLSDTPSSKGSFDSSEGLGGWQPSSRVSGSGLALPVVF